MLNLALMAQSPPDYIPQKRWWLKPLCALALLGLITWVGNLAYRRWEPDRLARQAQVFLEKGEPGNALLSLRRALQLDPNSESASRAMAEITSRLNTPITLDWHRRLMELNPDSAEDAFAWAGAAVRLGPAGSAEQALAAVPAQERGTARFYALQGTAALQAGKITGAERAFAEALRLEPGTELHQYNLATLRLQSPDGAQRDASRQSLEELARGGSMQTVARRSLVTFHLNKGDMQAAFAHSDPLQRSPDARFSDRIAHLQLLMKARPNEVEAELTTLQKRAERNPEEAALLMHWMNANGRSAAALVWSKALPKTIVANEQIAAAHAEILLASKDWVALREHCASGDWQSMEYLRHAFQARAARELDANTDARAHWTAASAAASRDRASAMRLAKMAQSWKWTDGYRETLWAAAKAPMPQWALQRLHESYRSSGESSGMLRTAAATLEQDPENLAARNNLAMLSLLRGERVEEALAEAKKLHTQAPRDPGFASTYAFALHVHGRNEEAIEIMEVLGSPSLQIPAVGAYYGIFLGAGERHDEAKPYLEAAKGAPLLPEERALIERALKAITPSGADQ